MSGESSTTDVLSTDKYRRDVLQLHECENRKTGSMSGSGNRIGRIVERRGAASPHVKLEVHEGKGKNENVESGGDERVCAR